MAASPSSSPRLPSPPPMAEDQLGAKSPTIAGAEHGQLGAKTFEGASRRIRPGTKAADMPEGPPLVPLKDIDTAFQLTEHLKALYNAAIHPETSSTIVPIDRATATRLAQPPDGVDKYLWLYELCRFLCQEVNKMIVALFAGDPPCSAQTCNEMRASEWQYLCAVHDPPKPCCAIDYCCHTLDWAANVLTSPKNFPSRLALATETGSGHQQLRQLTNIFRRVYRIFAHAWFQHRDMFWKVESKSGIYVFFKTVCDVYGLIPEDNYTVPPEAEGIEAITVATKQSQAPTVLKRGEEESKKAEGHEQQSIAATNIATATGHTTKRHRQTPSVDAGLITTVPEETEEEDDKGPKRSDTVIISNSDIESMISKPVAEEENESEKQEAPEEPNFTPKHEDAKHEELKLMEEAPVEAEEPISAGEPAGPTATSEPNHTHDLSELLTAVPQDSSVNTTETESHIETKTETEHPPAEEKAELTQAQEEIPVVSQIVEPETLDAEEKPAVHEAEVPEAEVQKIEMPLLEDALATEEPTATDIKKETEEQTAQDLMEQHPKSSTKKSPILSSTTTPPAPNTSKIETAPIEASDRQADAKDEEEPTQSTDD